MGLSLAGCVRDAVLENQVETEQTKALVLLTLSDLELAEAALSAQLVELEALRLRSRGDARVDQLLYLSNARLADGFIEARRLEAILAGDTAEAARQQERKSQAWARAMFYRKQAGGYGPPASFNRPGDSLSEAPAFSAAENACQKHDRAGYEAQLTLLLARRAPRPDAELSLALSQRLARSLLRPELMARCRF